MALEGILERLEKVTSRLESCESKIHGSTPSSSGGPPQTAGSTPFIKAYEQILEEKVKAHTNVAEKLGDEIANASKAFADAFCAEKKFLEVVAQCRKPSEDELQKLVQPVAEKMKIVCQLGEGPGRRSPSFNHFKTLGEGVQALSWVVYTGPSCGLSVPSQQVQECIESSDFYCMKILKEFREKDANHGEWVKSYKGLMTALQSYLKEFHKTGPAWKAKGIAVSEFKGSQAGPPPPPPGAPPPPGPPPKIDISKPSSAADNGGKSDVGALFADINQGGQITSGLRKVTDDMKTKNRKDRSGHVSAPSKEKPKASSEPVKPPKTELTGDKWFVENHVDNKSIVLENLMLRQSLYVYNCKKSVIHVKGKVAIVFDDLLSALEIVNCNDIQAQCTARTPSVSVDNTQGLELFLTKEGMDTQVLTAKSTAVVVRVPGKTEDDDLVEFAIPEQFISVFKNSKLESEPLIHSA